MINSQGIEKDGVISYITDPSGKIHLKLVSPEDFSRCEFDKTEIDYCMIVGEKLFISSKASYDHAIVHYTKHQKPILPRNSQ